MPASPRDIRRMAFQALYQLDARDGEDRELVRGSLDDLDKGQDGPIAATDRDAAMAIAEAAFATRRDADRAIREFAPTWPAHRQPAVDRAILRLAYHEMHAGAAHPKAVINEAVELAKRFSTDRSPAFVNAVLDKILKAAASPSAEPDPAAGEPA